MKDFLKTNFSTVFTVVLILFFFIHPLTILVFIALFIYLFYKYRNLLPRPNSRKVKRRTTYKFDPDEFIKDNMYMSRDDKESYLRSSKWKKLRQLVFKRDNFQCVTCKSTINLNCHHINYYRLGEEKLKDLTTLCNNCHEDLHEELGYDREHEYPPKPY